MGKVKLTTEQINELVEEMMGTCQSLDYVVMKMFGHLGVKSYMDLDINSLRAMDEEVFECEQCGWWYDIGFQELDSVCADCAYEEEDYYEEYGYDEDEEDYF